MSQCGSCLRPACLGRVIARPVSARAAASDPEAKFRKYGKEFGRRGHVVEMPSWMNFAPQVRVRQAEDRGKDQIGELAVLNERLAGQQSWQIRKRVEYLKQKRKAWENMVNNVVQDDVAMTLSNIETHLQEVAEALSEEKQEGTSISDLKKELLSLQEQIEEAHDRLHLTQSRVEQNITRISELKAEAATFERINRRDADAVRDAVSSQSEIVASRTSGVASTSNRSSEEATGVAANGVQTAPSRAFRTTKKSRGLNSSLNLERGLRNFWYPVSFVSSLKKDLMIPIELFGEKWVLFRDEEGKAACIYDQCAHRACPLSLGQVSEGQIACAYHGWQFNGRGECTKMPSTRHCGGIMVAHMPTVETDGWVWVWAGDAEPSAVPNNTLPPGNFTMHAEIEVEVPVEHGLLMENLLDLAHAPFTHTGTFARGWPIPDMVKFQTAKMLGGFWDPYPIDMTFEPPCMVVSMIGLKQPGKIESGARAMECERHLHQLHVCLPSRKGHTRLLYRMSLDFMGWIKYVPGITAFWKHIAGQVLGEDLVLVTGQQDRLKQGGDTWSHPVSYDKLAVRYRRWRNDVGDSVLPSPSQYVGATMSAGDVFNSEDEMFVDIACPLPEPAERNKRV